MSEWAFLTKHALVLSLIANHPRITGRELATAIGTTERAIRRVIADLYAEGYISKKRMGRGVKYRIRPDLSLRHDAHREIVIGDFLEALGWKKEADAGASSNGEGGRGQFVSAVRSLLPLND